GLYPLEAAFEYLGKQVMIAVPASLLVQRNYKQVRTIEGLQHRLARLLAGDRIAERTSKAFQDGGMQQKRLHGGGLAREHLLTEVIQHEAVTAGKGGQKRGDIDPALQRERGQLQAGHPSFGAAFEGSNGRCLQVELHHLAQKRADLIGRKAQIGSTHLGELSAGSQSCKQERWISTCCNDEMHVGWQVPKQ